MNNLGYRAEDKVTQRATTLNPQNTTPMQQALKKVTEARNLLQQAPTQTIEEVRENSKFQIDMLLRMRNEINLLARDLVVFNNEKDDRRTKR